MQSQIEAKLRQQQRDSETDSKWLIQEENNLVSDFALNDQVITTPFPPSTEETPLLDHHGYR